VSICARSRPDLEKAGDALRAYGGRVHTTSADVANASAVSTVIDGAIRDLGRIDILVNNAGDRGSSLMP
jgi:NAD(P)-dependent dehydrogenase (short-subunit alcohol dehydrogenase family)